MRSDPKFVGAIVLNYTLEFCILYMVQYISCTGVFLQ